MAASPGSNNRADGKRFSMALQEALQEARGESGQEKWAALKTVARKLVELAEEGNIHAIKEVADRLDGKPAQAVNLGDHEGNALTINLVTYGK